VVGWTLLTALVRTVIVVVSYELFEHCDGMPFVVDQHLVGALRSDAAHEPFCVTVCSERSRRGLHRVDALGGEHRVERRSVFGVSITDEEPELGDPLVEGHQQVAGGLRSPSCGWMRGRAENVDPTGADLHHEQHVQATQADGVQMEEVGSQQARCLSAQEGAPTGVRPPRRGTDAGGGEDTADRARTDAVPEPGEFSPARGDGPTEDFPEPTARSTREVRHRSLGVLVDSDRSISG